MQQRWEKKKLTCNEGRRGCRATSTGARRYMRLARTCVFLLHAMVRAQALPLFPRTSQLALTPLWTAGLAAMLARSEQLQRSQGFLISGFGTTEGQLDGPSRPNEISQCCSAFLRALLKILQPLKQHFQHFLPSSDRQHAFMPLHHTLNAGSAQKAKRPVSNR